MEFDPSQRPRLAMKPLGGAEIGRCLTRIHHDRFTPVPPPGGVDEVRARALTLGLAFEDDIVSLVMAATPGAVRIEGFGSDAVGDTLRALSAGPPLIVGGRLASADGSRVGAPDLLVRLSSGYAPIEIKRHRVRLDKGIPAATSDVTTLTTIDDIGVRFRSRRRRDLLQAEHYRRLLAEVGYASDEPLLGVIGNDEPLACTWVDATQGENSISSDYDAFVVRAEDTVAHGITHPDTPLEGAWLRGECSRCDWHDHCLADLERRDDVTVLRDVDAGVRSLLAAGGVRTVADVAALDPSDERLPAGTTVLQARARRAGGLLRADTGPAPMDLPGAEIEVDLDIETTDGRTYLAGLLITTGGVSRYEPIAEWSDTPAGKGRVLRALFDQLASWSRVGAIVYHWTDYERRMLGNAAAEHGGSIEGFESVDDWFDAHAVDLCAWSRDHLVSPDGYSLKIIAPLCGFAWRDDDPGGLQSEIWFERLLAGEESMRDRLLTYNEDDVVAQLAVRHWVRSHDTGAGPGSSIPSALRWPLEEPVPRVT